MKIRNINLRLLFWGIALILAGCSTNDRRPASPLKGDWCFLDRYGNYNEACFGDSIYYSVNRFFRAPVRYHYFVQKDTLWSNADRRKPGVNPIGQLNWIGTDKVVIFSGVYADTLERIRQGAYLLSSTDPISDSVVFWNAFYMRYESFLVAKGIITAEEAKDFREKQRIPEDVREKLTN